MSEQPWAFFPKMKIPVDKFHGQVVTIESFDGVSKEIHLRIKYPSLLNRKRIDLMTKKVKHQLYSLWRENK